VSGFLSLLRNILTRSPSNQENFMKNSGVGIVGDMLNKVIFESFNIFYNLVFHELFLGTVQVT
jgi:hypothetical protein